MDSPIAQVYLLVDATQHIFKEVKCNKKYRFYLKKSLVCFSASLCSSGCLDIHSVAQGNIDLTVFLPLSQSAGILPMSATILVEFCFVFY